MSQVIRADLMIWPSHWPLLASEPPASASGQRGPWYGRGSAEEEGGSGGCPESFPKWEAMSAMRTISLFCASLQTLKVAIIRSHRRRCPMSLFFFLGGGREGKAGAASCLSDVLFWSWNVQLVKCLVDAEFLHKHCFIQFNFWVLKSFKKLHYFLRINFCLPRYLNSTVYWCGMS